jgi:hypothetical protein
MPTSGPKPPHTSQSVRITSKQNVQAADAKEAGLGKPSEETCCHLDNYQGTPAITPVNLACGGLESGFAQRAWNMIKNNRSKEIRKGLTFSLFVLN